MSSKPFGSSGKNLSYFKGSIRVIIPERSYAAVAIEWVNKSLMRFSAYRIGKDEGIIQCISSTNIACGYHAGNPMVMDRVVKLAKEQGVAVGAHPGYPDLMGFGRRFMKISPEEVKNYVKYQIGAL